MEDLPAPRPAQPDAEPAAALLSSYGGRLYSYFRLMLDDDASAKRALADTLLAAVADEERPRDIDQYAPRLFTLARANCRKYEPAIAVNAGKHWTVTFGKPDSRPGLPEIARRAVARLAPDVREVFLLSAPHNGLALPQLAEVLQAEPDAADDLRTQAGVDFARTTLACAEEADFTEFSGTDLCVRAEESLARDASEPAPSLPILSDPALAAFREDVEAPPESAPPAPAPGAAGPPTLTSLVPAPPPPAPPAPRPSAPAPAPPVLVYVPPDATTPGDPAFLELGHRLVRKRSRRRGRAAFAWVGGGIAAMAALAIGANALMARSGEAARLAPGGATPAAVLPSADPGALAGSPTRRPSPRPSRTTQPAAPPPTYEIPRPTAPARTTKAPPPPPAKPTPKPTTGSPSPPVSPSVPPSGSGSPVPPPGSGSTGSPPGIPSP